MCKYGCRYSLLVAAIAMGVGCSGDTHESSGNVNTREIFATFQVVSDGTSQAFAEAQLTREFAPGDNLEPDRYISLTDGDRLWVSAGEHFSDIALEGDLFGGLQQIDEAQVELTPGRERRYAVLFGRVQTDSERYTATLSRSDDDEYLFALMRERFPDAPSSRVKLPLDFKLYSPLRDDSYSRSNDAISIEWAPTEPDTQVMVQVNTSCRYGTLDAVYTLTLAEDTGSLTLEPGTLVNSKLEGDCLSTVNLARSRLGSLDSAFTGGYLAGHQVRSRSIRTTD